VDRRGWKNFEIGHKVSSEIAGERTIQEVTKSLALPQLNEVWSHLRTSGTLADFALISRGIEWNQPLTLNRQETGMREKYVLSHAEREFRRGVPPLAKFNVFEAPPLAYLSMRPEDQRGGAYLKPWESPKVLVNKSRRSRGNWRMAAFADDFGLTAYQTFIGIWPQHGNLNIWALAAIINSPLANAFVSTHEGRQDVTIETLSRIPMPYFTGAQFGQLREFVEEYVSVRRQSNADERESRWALMKIDAFVLSGYHLPPRLEQRLLDFFNDDERSTPFEFGRYVPEGDDVYFSLSDRLKDSFRESTVEKILRRIAVTG